MAVKRSAALVFLISDSGEGYITVDGNEGDRCVMPSGKRGLVVNHLFSVKTLLHGMGATLSYLLWRLKTTIRLSS